MTDARATFRDLHEVAGHVFDTTALSRDPEPVESRVESYRTGRTVLLSVASVVAVGAVTFGVMVRPGIEDVGPATSPTPSALASSVPVIEDAAACNAATGIQGKAAGSLAGLEGWWNATPDAACEDWDQEILDHPDTVTINTGDNTMIEAYYRTSIDALGVYADLGPDFVVPDPDPDWPADSVIVIDATTGEVLSATPLSAFSDLAAGVDDAVAAEAELEDSDFFAVEAPYPEGASAPTLEDLVPRTEGATLVWERTEEIRYLSAEAQPGEFTVVKGDVAVDAARDWECAWLREYLWGAEAGEPQRVSDAIDALDGFSALDAIATYSPELGEAHEDALSEPLRDGDIEAVGRWVSDTCGGYSPVGQG